MDLLEINEHDYSAQIVQVNCDLKVETPPTACTSTAPYVCKSRGTHTSNPIMCNAMTQTSQKSHCLMKRIMNLNRLLKQRRSQVSFLKRKLEREVEKSNTVTRKKIIEGSDQYLSENEHMFMKLMLSHSQKDSNYTPEEKSYLLKFYVQSRTMYKFLQQEFRSLPCMSTMNKWLKMNPEILTEYQMKKKRIIKKKLSAKQELDGSSPRKRKQIEQKVYQVTETGELTEIIFNSSETDGMFELGRKTKKQKQDPLTLDAVTSIMPQGSVPLQVSSGLQMQNFITQAVALEDGNLAFTIPANYEIVLAQ